MERAPKESAVIAKEVYALSKTASIEEAAVVLNTAFQGRLVFSDTNMLKGITGGPGFIKVRTAFGYVLEGKMEFKDHYFIVFRGTQYLADWLTNLNILVERSSSGKLVHEGFNKAFLSMLPQIRPLVQNIPAGAHIHCIGHSLGGALATITAEWLSSQRRMQPYLYTYGSPRVGLKCFAEYCTHKLTSKKIYRVYHKTDIVPCIPIWPFTHTPSSGHEYFIYTEGLFPGSKWHDMDRYVDSVSPHSWGKLYDRRDERPTESSIKGWLQDVTFTSATMSAIKWFHHVLMYVVEKCTTALKKSWQAVSGASATIMDQLAYILNQGVNLDEMVSSWVVHLMRKISEFLGMAKKYAQKDLTRATIRDLLSRLSRRVNEMAQKALSDVLADGRAI
ncbi:lipase family protein [Parendozoicomonas sp. Alg238-R29]|uniref:lipase family protein n=1 Tax=Parendozoicomonas sp. Alg238-R29 TaxID=2993446 RepID=UPI00248DD0BB|nr:lipase family protein [Parendozoicomonas sp. Alg238-R29]